MELIDTRNKITISIRTLVEFILRSGNIDNRKKNGQDVQTMLEGAKIHRYIQQRMGADYHAEVPLRIEISEPDYDIVIEGRADGIIYNEEMLSASRGHSDTSAEYITDNALSASWSENLVTVDEIKSTYLDIDKLNAPVPVHLAQAKCYAYIFAAQNHLRDITVRMTYCNLATQEVKYFHETYTFVEIRNWFEDIVDKYKRWSDFEFTFKKIRDESIKQLEFPFDYRDGQKELVSQVYRTIYHKKKLFMEAPTGVGKTISNVFPSVKAMGEGLCDKLFYLTAKTITRTVAADCLDLLRTRNLRMKSVVITARDKICPLEKSECNPVACERAKGHYDRINDAMYDLLINEDSFTRETIEAYAAKHMVCPFEMCLDMSLFSDAIICDYNYVFDPNVYLRRFFGEYVSGRYIFLVDEAHNLVDRAMDMYSAPLYKEDFLTVKHLVKDTDKRLERALGSCNRKLLALKRECENVKVLEDISDFIMALNRCMSRLETFLEEEEHFKQKDEVLDFYFKVRHFLNMFDNMGEQDYRIYCEHTYDGDFLLKLLCVDPSESLKRRLTKGVSTVFFSATLLPVGYYKDMLGAEEDDYAVYAKSIFQEEKRGLFIARDVSSKYTRRNETEYYNMARYIHEVCSEKKGNYMVFFPSHAFLENVLNQYNQNFANDETEVLVQKASMTETEREEFLSRFEKSNSNSEDVFIAIDMPVEIMDEKTIIGFCVIGGIFSEGIDLKNDSLIGALVVGTGLPMVCNEREILKSSYELMGLNGFDYAYRYPGMNKVLQAAGRVIRTVDDVGIVVLLDERFISPVYARMFPREWSDYRICTRENVAVKVGSFWEEWMEYE